MMSTIYNSTLPPSAFGACMPSMLYTAADGTELPMLVFDPPADVRPAAGVVLFHGGALRKGSVDDLAPHCRRLASHGVFAVSAGYRLPGKAAAGIDASRRAAARPARTSRSSPR